jgi:Fic family protein
MLLNELFYTPIVSVKDIAKHFKISYPTAVQLINQFDSIGILKEITSQKRSKRFVYSKYMAILAEGTDPL